MPEEGSDDLTPEQIEEFMKHAAAEVPHNSMNELWMQFNEIYLGLVEGGFTEAQASSIIVDLMWKFMVEGSK